MKTLCFTISLVSLPLALDLPAWGQGTNAANQISPSVRRGIVSTVPVGVSLDSEFGAPVTSREILIKDPGDQGGILPQPWSAARFPGTVSNDYSLGALFSHLSSTDLELVELAAVCTGNNTIPRAVDLGQEHWAGTPQINLRWFALSVTVDDNTIGIPGSVIAQRQGLGQSFDVSADIYSYYFDGSTGIAAGVANSTLLEQGREHLGFSPSSDTSIDGLDYGLGVMPHQAWVGGEEFWFERESFYFALTPKSAGALGTLVIRTGPTSSTGVAAQASAIYKVEWNSGTNMWNYPVEYKTASELGLDSGDQIDAIAVSDKFDTLIFSTQPLVGRSQLLFHQSGGDDAVVQAPLTTEAGDFVAEQLGLDGQDPLDNITGACSIDPENGDFDTHLGTPVEHVAFGPGFYQEPLGLSVVRAMKDPNSNTSALEPEEYRVQVTGLESLGAGPGFVVFVMGYPDNWNTVATIPFSDASEAVQLQVPAPEDPTPSDLGNFYTMRFAAVAFGSNGDIGTTYQSEIVVPD